METSADYGKAAAVGDETKRKQANLSLADRVADEYAVLAAWMGTPYNTLLRQIIEQSWANPDTQALIKRAMADDARRTATDDGTPKNSAD